MTNSIKSYRDLRIWNLAMEIAEEIYEVSRKFPDDERFGLTSQVRKSAVSVPSNIAEGHARNMTGDYRRFLKYSNGSLAEMETQVILGGRFGYVDEPKVESVLDRTGQLGRMVNSLISKLPD